MEKLEVLCELSEHDTEIQMSKFCWKKASLCRLALFNLQKLFIDSRCQSVARF